MATAAGDVTLLLAELANGKKDAADQLLPLVYDELRRVARRHLRHERIGHTLQPTALVHEAYLKLVNQRDVTWRGRAHFIGVASRIMRRILVDHARKRLREKRGGGQENLPLNENLVGLSDRESEELIALDAAPTGLRSLDDRQSRIVEMRYFGGLTNEETAEVLGISARTVKREWAMARAWLRSEIRPEARP